MEKNQDFTSDEARRFQRKILSEHEHHQSKFRVLLIQAHESKIYVALKMKSTDEFFQDTANSKHNNSGLSYSYLQRQYRAGLVEKQLFGKNRIGEMRESVARILSENVPMDSWSAVYKLAEKAMPPSDGKMHPTAKGLKDAAEELDVYRQQESKLKPSPASSGKKVEKAKTKPQPSSRKSKHKSQDHSNVIGIDTSKPLRLGRHIFDEHGEDFASLIAHALEVLKSPAEVDKAYGIIKKIPYRKWGIVINGIDSSIRKSKAKNA